MKYKLAELLDISNKQKLLDSFCDAVGVAAAIIDLQGNVLISSRWQKICTDFHRTNEHTCAKCLESDIELANSLTGEKSFSIYSCKNGLTDAASPIIIEGEHVANAFVGQFLLEPPDHDFFRTQAAQYGFDERSYLDALVAVPRVTEKMLPSILEFLTKFAGIVVNMSLKQIEALETQEALTLSQTLLNSLIKTLPDLVWLKDTEGKYLACNSRFESFFGAREKDIIGKTDYDFVDKELADFFRNHDKAALAKGSPSKNEEEIVFAEDGHREILETIKTPMFGNDGQITGVLGIGRDITKRKQIEEALRDSHSFTSNLLENSPNAILVYNPDSSVKYVNPLFEELTGYTSEEVIGTKIPYPWWIEDPDFGTIEQRRKLGFYKSYRAERRYRKKNGEQIWVIMAVTPIFHNDKFINSLSTWVDITDIKKSEKEKEKLQNQLQQAQKMEAIGTLAGGIAHDFNNILSPIMAYSDMAMMDLPESSPIQQSLFHIKKAGMRARDLVKQILTFARIREEKRIPLKASLIVKEAVKFLKSTIPSTIDIQYDWHTKKDTVLADPTQMNQIIMNLCTNAAHAMRENGGVLEVILKDEEIGPDDISKFDNISPGHYLRITVKDTGPGIPPEIIDNIFEPYFTTKGPNEGTGLGLAVVHGIVKSYEGDIIVESEVGTGTAFHVLLPLVEEESPEISDVKENLPRGNEHILLVDDEEVIIKVERLMLERLGYRVKALTSSVEVLEIFRNNPDEFNLVITDMTMPAMTGKELAKELLHIRPDLPIILYTGFSDQINEDEAKEIGIRALVMKPVIIHEIANIIRDVLDTKESHNVS